MVDGTNWDLLMVLGGFTAVMCALGWYVHTHRAPEPESKDEVVCTRYFVECGREADGSFWAAVPALPGLFVGGETEDDAKAQVSALALRALAERLESRKTKAHAFSFHISA